MLKPSRESVPSCSTLN